MELPGAIKVLSFRNCELYCCHLDGYKSQREAFLKRLKEIEQYFANKPPENRYRIWFNVDETTLDDLLINEIVSSVIRIQGHIVKIAFIGLSRMKQWKLERKLKSATRHNPLPHSYFYDAEKAKEWLV